MQGRIRFQQLLQQSSFQLSVPAKSLWGNQHAATEEEDVAACTQNVDGKALRSKPSFLYFAFPSVRTHHIPWITVHPNTKARAWTWFRACPYDPETFTRSAAVVSEQCYQSMRIGIIKSPFQCALQTRQCLIQLYCIFWISALHLVKYNFLFNYLLGIE